MEELELEEDIYIRCDKCSSIINILKDQIAFNVYRYEHGDNGMGDEIRGGNFIREPHMIIV